MAYTELDCDDTSIPLRDLERGSMVRLSDGSYAQQVVIVTIGGGSGDFNGDFSSDFNI